MKRTALGASLAAVLLLLAGCGDDKPEDGSGAADADTKVSIDSDASPKTDPAPESSAIFSEGDPVDTLKKVFEAYLADDADTACGLQTERYTKAAISDAIKEDYVENGASCADLVSAASALYKAFDFDPTTGTYEEIKNDGESATVTYKSGDDDPETYLLVNTDEGWLLDDEL